MGRQNQTGLTRATFGQISNTSAQLLVRELQLSPEIGLLNRWLR
jgi:hypothetical protein